jgi:hypothetical protein
VRDRNRARQVATTTATTTTWLASIRPHSTVRNELHLVMTMAVKALRSSTTDGARVRHCVSSSIVRRAIAEGS